MAEAVNAVKADHDEAEQHWATARSLYRAMGLHAMADSVGNSG
ncbi:hypothetical protein [Nonomuraea gerenzanensis]|uniref:Uncharacterized protein n=1 Tax=Nonomuraea gerenzanensis TaxID=93944 RepID=A0A1M4EAC0_9ACTN|nr:hypothetical protein [Nonomuraea gerenzanensis]SBO95702.1 hypothetical protein BN4615_P5218 [Nonomuraea gerenzanensis]